MVFDRSYYAAPGEVMGGDAFALTLLVGIPFLLLAGWYFYKYGWPKL